MIMIFEMTRDYSIIVPLMISNMISFFISRTLQPEPIYEALALQEGIYLPTAESRAELAGPAVSEIITADPPLLSPDSDLPSAEEVSERSEVQRLALGRRQAAARIDYEARA